MSGECKMILKFSKQSIKPSLQVVVCIYVLENKRHPLNIKHMKKIIILSVVVMAAVTLSVNESAAQTRRKLDRKENRVDRREDVRDRREDVRDRREDVRDKKEDIRDRRENKHDRREDVRDRKEDRRDRKRGRF